jgi:hypothetical protein
MEIKQYRMGTAGMITNVDKRLYPKVSGQAAWSENCK